MHSEFSSRGRKVGPGLAQGDAGLPQGSLSPLIGEGVGLVEARTWGHTQGPEILTDAGLACRMDSGPERAEKEPTGRTIVRRSWAARGQTPRRK
jgi:hypothetical protein